MIVIDPARGGSDSGNVGNGIVEKEYALLISQYIYNRLKELGADVKIIRDSDEYINDNNRINRINNAYGNNSKVVALSNRLGSRDENGIEIIYALRNNDTLAESIKDELENEGAYVNKWYQKRSEQNTAEDYDNIQRNTGLIETIIVDYGNIANITDANNIKENWQKYAEAVVKALANYKGIPYYKNEEETYIVKKGDSLYKIAKKYGLTVSELMSYNNLKNTSLSIGQVLRIPNKKVNNGNISSETYIVQSGDSLYKIAQKFNTTVDKLKQLNNLTSNLLNIGQILIVKEGNTTSESENNVYIVKKGDSLYTIAQKFNTTVEELKQLNNLTSNLLNIGQRLKIPTSSAENIYVVKKGDSLYTIAQKFNTTVEELKQLNNLTSNLLNIGQRLKIPTSSAQNIYIVKKGDSLYTIAQKFNTTVNELKQLNNLTSNLLNIGTQLIIPN